MHFIFSNLVESYISLLFFSFQITVAFDETTTLEDVDKLFHVFAGGKPVSIRLFLLVARIIIHFLDITNCGT